MSQLYALEIIAVGEVRDSDGNLVSNEPIEATVTLTEEQAREFSERHTS